MCGIIGILGIADAARLLIDGLKRLEYRGYDSAGIATLVDGRIDRRRAQGKLSNLADVLEKSPLSGNTGIGHTRWATHGVPSEENAHPHATDRVAIVHNGIIENYQELRDSLSGKGITFSSQTDTEVVAHLVSDFLEQGMTPKEAVAKTMPMLEGAFGFVMVFAGYPDLMVGARRGSPLAIGYGDGEMFFGSDALALAPMTRRISYLEEGDWAVITRTGAEVFDTAGNPVERKVVETAVSGALIGKGNYRHFMLKEIYEQPAVIGDTLHSVLNPATQTITLPDLPFDWTDVPKITIGACGTASYAGMVAKYWFEGLARLPVEVDVGSELRYRSPPLPKNGLALFVSQSGETMDTLEALRYCKSEGQRILSVVNVPESTIARASDAVLLTQAGPEIGVASTKAFTTQLTILACLAIAAAKARGHLDRTREATLAAALSEVPGRAAEVLNHDDYIREIAQTVAEARDVFFMGRGSAYPIAMEGALKLKEISYIHAEGYAAGEMKHGPLALIEEDVPIVMIAPSGPLFEKTASNVQEMISRGGKVIFLSDGDGIAKMNKMAKPFASIELPKVDPFVAPILYTIPVQMLAYHTAVWKGTDVDQPRNLAKAVTVE
ncbi:glutamine--fructose-6-phosphate transaminase (isomerizing) [Rhodospirillaceae bacterium KN72]|uniref:Glutamine--fructose-6-phosphate aminotransferase [isomerizing] n=1 Tax=Pacificispira spongiicola TaxID=2729598 RepID=A0A7Y0HG51_9PROT|nr:glutamine--fructose-6-phosphate transaminase (isomerizing) [Pacificispira spongiicola]NMM46521.1 glutamine--fructose-6-phosphate transaminase (isomerizing) [Pacificispira spongiicola]